MPFPHRGRSVLSLALATGLVGTASLARLLVSLGLADRFVEWCKPPPPAPQTMDEFLAASVPPRVRQRVRRKLPQP